MKIRPQTALASLTPEERQHIANLLADSPGQTYEAVRELLAKPRAEGGYGLQISIKPLQVLHHRETQRRLFNNCSPRPVSLDDFIAIQNGDDCPETKIGQMFVQINACHLAMNNPNLSPRDLLALSRVLNIPLEQERVRHNMQIQSRRAAAIEKRNQIAERRLEKSRSPRPERPALVEAQFIADSRPGDADDASPNPTPAPAPAPAQTENALKALLVQIAPSAIAANPPHPSYHSHSPSAAALADPLAPAVFEHREDLPHLASA